MLHKAMLAATLFLALAVGGKSMASGMPFDFKDPKEISAVSLALDSKLEPIVGYAKGISGTVVFDPANPLATTGKIAVDVSSVQFANEGYTATARGYALNGAKYPQIFFALRKVLSITKPTADTYKATVLAEFTCRGITREMKVPVTATYLPGRAEERTNGKYKGDLLIIRTRFNVSRTQHGISEGIPSEMVGDTIQVGVAVVGIHYAPGQNPQAELPLKPADEKAPEAASVKTAGLSDAESDVSYPRANRRADIKCRLTRQRGAYLCQAAPPSETPQQAMPPRRAQMDQPAPLDYTLPEIRSDQKTSMVSLPERKAGGNLVVFFLSEQCGVTFYYKKRIQQLQQDFESRGFAFVGVRCGKREKPDAPLDLAETKYLKMPFVDDIRGDLASCFQIRQSVTFVVVDKAGVMRYRGGFDDNVDEKHVKKTYLRNALREVATGTPVTVKEGRAIGCAIIPLQ